MQRKLPKLLEKENIFIGYNVYKEKCLLYKLDYNLYYDLERKEYLHRGLIINSSLMNYNEVVEKQKKYKKKTIIKQYNKENNIIKNNKVLEANNVLLVDVYKIEKDSKTNDKNIVVSENRLVYRKLTNGKAEYVDLINNKKYKEVNYGIFKAVNNEYIKQNEMYEFYNTKQNKTKKEIVDDYKEIFGISSYTGINSKRNNKVKVLK